MNPRDDGPGLPHLSEDDVVDLANDLLDEPTRSRMVAHAAACPRCDGRLREVVGAHERGRARAQDYLARADAPEMNAHGRAGNRHASASTLRRSRPTAVLLVAAGVLMAAAAGVVWQQLGTARSLASLAQPAWLPTGFDASPERRSGALDADSTLFDGIAAYERRDHSSAESLLAVPCRNETLEWVRRLYRANLLVALGRPAEAVPLLDSREVELLPEPWSGEAQWTLLVSLARTGATARADSLLRLLSVRDDEIGVRARGVGRRER